MQSQALIYLCVLAIITLTTIIIRNVIRHNKEQKEYREQRHKQELIKLSQKLQKEHADHMAAEHLRRDFERLNVRRTTRDQKLIVVWSSSAPYRKGDRVLRNNRVYLAKEDNMNTYPEITPLFWMQLSDSTL